MLRAETAFVDDAVIKFVLSLKFDSLIFNPLSHQIKKSNQNKKKMTTIILAVTILFLSNITMAVLQSTEQQLVGYLKSTADKTTDVQKLLDANPALRTTPISPSGPASVVGMLPLGIVARYGQVWALNALAPTRDNINARDTYKNPESHVLLSWTALHHAASSSNASGCLEWLLTHGAGPKIADTEGKIPLHLAATESKTQALIKAYPDSVATKDHTGRIPLHDAKNADVAKALLAADASTISIPDKEGRTPLFYHGDYILDIDAPISDDVIQYKDNLGQTVAHYASRHGERGNLIKLGKRGYLQKIVNEKDNFGETAMHWCSHPETVAILKQYGGDLNAQDTNGNTPLHWQIRGIYTGDGGGSSLSTDALGEGARGGRMDGVAEALLQSGANPNIQNKNGNTPLHVAVIHQDITAAEALLKADADKNSKNNAGQSPLDLAKNKCGTSWDGNDWQKLFDTPALVWRLKHVEDGLQSLKKKCEELKISTEQAPQ